MQFEMIPSIGDKDNKLTELLLSVKNGSIRQWIILIIKPWKHSSKDIGSLILTSMQMLVQFSFSFVGSMCAQVYLQIVNGLSP